MEERYSRQILFPEIGKAGQEKLLNSRVLIVGCGALGASHAEMLSRAGVGRLRTVDRDFVEFTNLQRQPLFKESDAAERLPKAVAAKARIAEINSGIDVEAIIARLRRGELPRLRVASWLIYDQYLIANRVASGVRSYGEVVTFFGRGADGDGALGEAAAGEVMLFVGCVFDHVFPGVGRAAYETVKASGKSVA